MEKDLETQRHSLSHILAMAVLEMFPDAKLGMGPAIENGFYYDFDLSRNLTPEDLPVLEKKMAEIKSKGLQFEKSEVDIAAARQALEKQLYKVELIDDLEKEGEKTVSTYKTGEFIDLCKGPHVETTSGVGAFKLSHTSGAYWKGDEKNPMLQRIYGYAFETEKELEEFLTNLEEAKKRDHKRLGPELGLFVFSELVGPGLPLYTNKGATLRREIANFSNQLRKKIGYEEVLTPQINKAELFKISGHYDKYKDDMFKVSSNYTEEEYYLKPMNCPQHTQIYASQLRSYKDLPIRIADFANLYRDEKPGQLSGLTRLRGFSQDDGHCFCREDQVEQEMEKILDIIKEAMSTYRMDYYIRLSLRDEVHKEKYIGDDQSWEKAQKMLEELLKRKDVKYVRAEGEAAFYGPKLDLMAKDSLGREWQLSTIQADPNMPKRFGLEYMGADGKKHTPVMIHSALVGSPERFMGVLIEHYAGNFPLWLSPVQVRILPVSDKHSEEADKIKTELEKDNIRVETDNSAESVGKKIRNAELEKIPYMLVIGDKEIQAKKVALRARKEGDLGQVSLKELTKKLQKELEEKK